MLETMMDRMFRRQEELADLQKTASVKQDSMDSVVRGLAEKFGIGRSHHEESYGEEHEEETSNTREKDYTTEFRRQAMLLNMDLEDEDILTKYLGGLHTHLRRKVISTKPKDLNEACVQASYIDDEKKQGEAKSRAKQSTNQQKKEYGQASNKGKWKGKGKQAATTLNTCKDPKNFCKNCDINGHTDTTCWKLHLELHPKNRTKDSKKSITTVRTEGEVEIEDDSDVDERLGCIASNMDSQEEEMSRLF
ncbi:hypothetical protein KI387_043765 [Taxus chinensis]|uniref:Uncharacterized protein n=1 Tax=Taxus chinensis TaxID=29808 RepID=A0AA38LL96_TAXCH|nr:hypothetical protein KI387_043765 [Taxus chinensis]